MFYFTFIFCKNYFTSMFWMVHTTMPLFRDNHKVSSVFVLSEVLSSFNLAKDIYLANSMLKDVFFLLIQHNATCILTQNHKIMSISVWLTCRGKLAKQSLNPLQVLY